MLAATQTLAVNLGNVNNLGNPACLCKRIPTVPLINLRRQTQPFVGGDGSSSDNNGQAFPCIPNGGDVFGCEPCSAPDRSLLYNGNFLHALLPFPGIRGMSDGPGDPLHLPGFPFPFFLYKQIAAENAALVAQAFLQSWAGP